MARLFKRRTVKGSPWYASYTVTLPNGRTTERTVSTRTPEKAIAQQVLTKLQSDAAVRYHGIVDPLADAVAREASRPIGSHLVDYTNKLVAAGRTADHIKRVQDHVKEYAAHAGIETVGEFSADTANAWAADFKRNGMAARTIQARLTSIKSLTKWLTSEDKLIRDPFASVCKPDPKGDRRRERRMLLPTEWNWLVHAINEGKRVLGMAARERLLLYRLCIQTGLRAGEVRSLGRGSFHLDGSSPFVRVVSGDTKNRKAANQYIDDTLASDLRVHVAKKLPKATAFNLPAAYEMAEMLRIDLESARRLWVKDAPIDERAKREDELFLTATNYAGECLDFHSLRHTCGAWLALRGVQAKVIQSVMRHSSITLTLDTYGHLIAGAEAAAIMDTADMTAVPQLLVATGTDGACTSGVRVSDARRVLDGAKPCDTPAQNLNDSEPVSFAFRPVNNVEFATSCDDLQDVAGSTPARTRTLDPGIKSPLLYQLSYGGG